MDDASTPATSNRSNRVPLGMSSFGPREKKEFGQSIRLAMACIEGRDTPTRVKAMPSDAASIRLRLKSLSQDMTSHHADLLELLVRFDDMKGWESSGSRHCAAWMNLELGVSMSLGWEYLRVGRILRTLPTTTALFRAGRIAWSKIRLIAYVANPDNEKTLCHAALDASVSEVARLCNEYKWKEDNNDAGEKDRARKQYESRSLTWSETSVGCTCIRLVLPPEVAQAFLNSVEHSLKQLMDMRDGIDNNTANKELLENKLRENVQPENVQPEYEHLENKPPENVRQANVLSDNTISQRRADAAVLMAESSLQYAGRDMATADRYQVIVSVDASNLKSKESEQVNKVQPPKDTPMPAKRPTVKGVGSIAKETVRRIACDCSVTWNTTIDGEPTDIGRKSRLWPPAMARAIKERDQHCQFNGCVQKNNLQIHHITHWADGGSTSVSNGVCLCQSCHTKVHEGGYSIQTVGNDAHQLTEQFIQQQHIDDNSLFDFEKELRNDRESFNRICKLSPTRYRFRILDPEGCDVRDTRNAVFNQGGIRATHG